MVDTTGAKASNAAASDLTEAGAPDEIEITPAMIEAGERAIFAFGVEPWLSTGDWASDLANQVYRAMAQEDSTMRNRSQSRNRAK